MKELDQMMKENALFKGVKNKLGSQTKLKKAYNQRWSSKNNSAANS